MSESQNDQSISKKAAPMLLADFLEAIPPNQGVGISDLAELRRHVYGSFVEPYLRTPELRLHCDDDACNGMRFFRCTVDHGPALEKDNLRYDYLTYLCSNCQKTQKIFSLAAWLDEADGLSGGCFKFGEFPPFGPPTPSRLIKLVGPDREEFLKGRRCENQGLGIGAFTYYRRVVENQKNRILGEIIKVAEKLGADRASLQPLIEAREETQFSKALAMARDAIPQSLLINGQNPLGLLHGALSDGVHDRSDEECLEIASSVRVVLAELSERLGQALKDEAELSKAISTLINRRGIK
jgi:hypothetical protein